MLENSIIFSIILREGMLEISIIFSIILNEGMLEISIMFLLSSWRVCLRTSFIPYGTVSTR